MIAANALVVISSSGDDTKDAAKLRHAQVALVLGAQVQPDGRMSWGPPPPPGASTPASVPQRR